MHARNVTRWGWGDSFHFAPRFPGESFTDSIKRHEHYLALAGQVRHGVARAAD